MDKQRSFWNHLLIGLGLVALAGLLHFTLDTLLTPLPADYASETQYATEDEFRDSPTGEWQSSNLIIRRVDQTLSVSGGVSIIQGDLHVTSTSGEVIFESSGLYGVDRCTRQNLAGYGDIGRTGQFLFPLHLQRVTYEYWDPMFIGSRTATFDHAENLDGLEVYVFHFTGTGMDETAGYSALPDVPDRYDAHTDGQGRLWIEPVLGIVVDYEEQGISYFVDRASGERMADFHEWSDRYTPETQAAQLALARAARTKHLALELWLPGGLLLAGLFWLAVSLWRHRK
ncbi:MAG: DUF3068 domain-containing protein [Anaerolineales bacterium]|nr:DUF3068 domain-containing protein [Anaerolineales bacterium]